MTTLLTIAALEGAIENRRPQPGLVHDSDKGFQYVGTDYVALTEKHGIVSSMSRPANHYDNAGCESFIKIQKREEICANAPQPCKHRAVLVLAMTCSPSSISCFFEKDQF